MERNAIVLPSGDTAGSRAGPALDKMRCHAPPFGSAEKIFHAPPDSAETINRPPGTSAAAGASAARLVSTEVESSVEAKSGVENAWLDTRRASAAQVIATANARGRIVILFSATLLLETAAIIP